MRINKETIRNMNIRKECEFIWRNWPIQNTWRISRWKATHEGFLKLIEPGKEPEDEPE